MVKKETALLIQKRAMNIVAKLDNLLSEIHDQCTDEDYQIIKRGVGLSIGRILTEILEPIYKQHPEIDDLRDEE
jgi:hypothetical protein